MEGTDVFEEKLAGLLEEAKKKKNVLEYQEVMNYFGQEPPVSNQLDRLFEFLDQNKVDVIRMGTEDELDPDLFIDKVLSQNRMTKKAVNPSRVETMFENFFNKLVVSF